MARKYLVIIVSLIALVSANLACSKLLPSVPAEDKILDGPVEGLSGEQHKIFLRGDRAFNNDIFTTVNGLGPMFVATSCGSCHAGDGKGHPFTTLTRFGQSDTIANLFLHAGGPQLQQRAIPGYQPELIPPGASFSKFTPPANTGLGLLEAVPDATILNLADPNDIDGDGISGRPNWIHMPAYCQLRANTIERNGKYIGRFGKKAAVYDLLQQTANAYNQDMGINSSYESYDTYNGLQADAEISNQTVTDVVFYLQTLKAPIPRAQSNSEVIAGKKIFIEIGCGKCHTPELQTGVSPIAALSKQTIFPYTDLLLHDMGSALNDGYTEGTATTAEWRTPALWGLGLSKNSQGGQVFLLHDGRAKNLNEAILLHGGEASQTTNNYRQLSAAEKNRLTQFLESL